MTPRRQRKTRKPPAKNGSGAEPIPRRRASLADRAAARIYVKTGSLAREVQRLARWVPVVQPVPAAMWRDGPERDLTPDELRPRPIPGEWGIPAPRIHWLLTEALRRAEAGQYLAARDAYDAAEKLARPHYPVMRAMLQRNHLEELEKNQSAREMRLQKDLPQIGNEAKRSKATRSARRYVKAANEVIERNKGRHLATRLSSVASHLERYPPRWASRVGARQILRYLRAAGLK